MSKATAKTVLITGTSSGFGRDTAETLARAGHNVFASMRDSKTKNRNPAEQLRLLGIEVVDLDVGNDGSVERAVSEVLAKAGHIDVLVNNAGIASAGVTEAFTPDQANIVFNTNVVGLLRTSRAVLPVMRKRGEGLIINIGSVVGRITFPFFGVYGASKFAVEALTDSLRYEVSQLGIEVVLVQPSAYPTSIFANIQQPGDADRITSYGTVGEIPGSMFEQFTATFAAPDAPNPHDVAEAIAKLVAQPKGSRAARTVVGAAFGADTLNEQIAPVQAHVLEALGLGHLGKVA